MQALATSMNNLWSVLAIVAQIISIVIIGIILTRKTPAFLSTIVLKISNNAVLVVFVVSLLATLGSLIYSDVIGYEPCKLCWFQRIFMYPLVILSALALWKKDSKIRIYALTLSIVGGLVALFHYVGQLGFNPFGLECLAIGYSASCAKNFVLEFGYITIPVMAFSAFLLISTTLWLSLRDSKAAEDTY